MQNVHVVFVSTITHDYCFSVISCADLFLVIMSCISFDMLVYCKNSLCRKEIFTDITTLLMKEDITLTQKRVSVYLLFVLVVNNSKNFPF